MHKLMPWTFSFWWCAFEPLAAGQGQCEEGLEEAAEYGYLNRTTSVHKAAHPPPERDIHQQNTPLDMQFFYVFWIIFLEDWCPMPFYCRTLSSAFTKGRISVKWWRVTSVIYLINFLQLYSFIFSSEKVIRSMCFQNRECHMCKLYQKYCFESASEILFYLSCLLWCL